MWIIISNNLLYKSYFFLLQFISFVAFLDVFCHRDYK